jgi:hypothetical protein
MINVGGGFATRPVRLTTISVDLSAIVAGRVTDLAPTNLIMVQAEILNYTRFTRE